MSVRAMVILDGAVAGLIGAAIVAIFFLFMDAVTRLPLYTPTVMGEGLFLPEDGASLNGAEKVSLKLTLMYSGVHGLVFMLLGVFAACLLVSPKRKLHFGIMLVALFVVLEFGFVGAAFVLARPSLDQLAWFTVLVGNLLAATGMASYLWLRRAATGV